MSVLGTFVRERANIVFAQTFVLEKQLDSHKDHFYCRNDMFVELGDGILQGPLPEFGKEIADRELALSSKKEDMEDTCVKDGEESVDKAEAGEDIEVEKVDKTLPVAVGNGAVEPSISVVTENAHQEEGEDEQHQSKEEQVVEDSAVNGIAEDVEPPEEDAEIVEAEGEPTAEKGNTAESVPNGKVEEEEEEEEVVVSATPAKKTWASIVSAKEDAHKEAVDVRKGGEEVGTSRVINDQVENIPPVEDSKPNVASHHHVQTQHHQSQRSNSATQNSHRANHITGRGGHQRTYGPSAVVHLSSLNPTQLEDPRALSGELRMEFGQYGHKLRHVEVKAQKGIAFVEYETMEGVRAAVAAWSNGPRKEGVFAGVPLAVQEKRPYNPNHKWRSGNMRGGRGGVRGGRRNRPVSTPFS